MSYGLYIHIPFCRRKCPYCGFASITAGDEMTVRYAEAVALELQRRCTGIFGGYPHSIYIGGGTPSIMPASCLKTIIERFLPVTDVEFTAEANPESLDDSWLAGIRELGVNRISIGVQSLDDSILKTLGRIHTSRQARESVHRAHRAGFNAISVDLMFGVPGQTMGIWQETLDGVLDLQPDHISCYSLNVEEDTIYFDKVRNHELFLPDPAAVSEMYVYMTELLEKNGLLRYEISNFAHPGYECRHNQGYWDFTPYLGVGASAHSFDGSTRSWNESNPEIYIDSSVTRGDTISGYEVLEGNKKILELVMLALRTRDGLSLDHIISLYPAAEEKLRKKIHEIMPGGFLEEYKKEHVRLTTRGVIISDEIISEIVSEIP
jgi:oxygen-independent coproporphyrinogen-3 oxidase